MKTVRVERPGPIWTIVLDRPEQRNCISREMNAELWEVWREFDASDARVAILTGEGDSFCTGADLGDYIPTFFEDSAREVRRNAETGIGGITRGLHRIYKPIVAAVNGHALAGGFELALACDLRVASRRAVFGSYEIRRGFHHADGGIVRLMASVGLSRTLDLVLTGRDLPAEEALGMGLVSEVVEPEALLPTAHALAERLASLSPAGLRSAKETILDVIGRPIDDALRLEALNGYSSGSVDEIRTALEQFFEKRR